MSTGMILSAIFAAETVDSSGEVFVVKGADISSFENGDGLVNYEHKSEKDGNGEEVVGKVLSAKKLYSLEDCLDEREREAWKAVKLPLIFGYVRLFDGAGHSGAQALAAAIRDQVANSEKILLRWSIEGSTLERKDNRLLSTICRRLAATWKPCNKICDTAIISDPNAPAGFDKEHAKKKDILLLEESQKHEHPLYTRLGGSVELEYNPIVSEVSLAKTLTAGSTNVAPSMLSGGAALQSEDRSLKNRALAALRDSGDKKFNKDELRTFVKHRLPEASDEFINHFVAAAHDLNVKRSLLKKEETFNVTADALDISLRKAVSDLASAPAPAFEMPSVHSVHLNVDGKQHPAGRYMTHAGNLHHLEDYYGLVGRLLPQGKISHNTSKMIASLKSGPELSVKHNPIPELTSPPIKAPTPILPTAPPKPKRPSVFHYTRVGHDRPHTLEVQNGHYLLDGKKLSYPEVQTVVGNVKSGAATIRYRHSEAASQIRKMEEVLDTLLKAEAMNPDDALQHVRAAVKAGHIHPDVERALTAHIFQDPMVPGMGNRYAYEQRKKENKPGVHVALDLNSFSAVNNAHGHSVGDQAIKTFGGLAQEAAQEAAPGTYRAERQGGDEFHFQFPSNVHAAKFARSLSQKLESVPPIAGVHKLSTSFGMGLNHEDADTALYAAKAQKYHPGQEGIPARQRTTKFKAGQEPSFGHSLIPGQEGPMPLRNENAEAVHAVSRLPETSTPSQSAA